MSAGDADDTGQAQRARGDLLHDQTLGRQLVPTQGLGVPAPSRLLGVGGLDGMHAPVGAATHPMHRRTATPDRVGRAAHSTAVASRIAARSRATNSAGTSTRAPSAPGTRASPRNPNARVGHPVAPQRLKPPPDSPGRVIRRAARMRDLHPQDGPIIRISQIPLTVRATKRQPPVGELQQPFQIPRQPQQPAHMPHHRTIGFP